MKISLIIIFNLLISCNFETKSAQDENSRVQKEDIDGDGIKNQFDSEPLIAKIPEIDGGLSFEALDENQNIIDFKLHTQKYDLKKLLSFQADHFYKNTIYPLNQGNDYTLTFSSLPEKNLTLLIRQESKNKISYNIKTGILNRFYDYQSSNDMIIIPKNRIKDHKIQIKITNQEGIHTDSYAQVMENIRENCHQVLVVDQDKVLEYYISKKLQIEEILNILKQRIHFLDHAKSINTTLTTNGYLISTLTKPQLNSYITPVNKIISINQAPKIILGETFKYELEINFQLAITTTKIRRERQEIEGPRAPGGRFKRTDTYYSGVRKKFHITKANYLNYFDQVVENKTLYLKLKNQYLTYRDGKNNRVRKRSSSPAYSGQISVKIHPIL